MKPDGICMPQWRNAVRSTLVNFDFSDDQLLLRESARRALAAHAGAARLALDAPGGLNGGLWELAAQMGWLGAAIPERFGGVGLGRLELCVLAEEFGRILAPIPFSSTVYGFAETLMACAEESVLAQYLPQVAAGKLIGTLAASEGAGAVRPASITTTLRAGRLYGRKMPVIDGDQAQAAIVLARQDQGDLRLVLVDLREAGVTRRVLETLDPTRGHAELIFDGAPGIALGQPGSGWEEYLQASDRMAALLAFEQLGGAQACLDMAVAFAKSRYAFGRPIGSFQAIKHKLADMYVAIEVARSNAYYGAWALEHSKADLALAAAAARVAASEAFSLAAKENLQTHGGMGFTWAADCHLFLRRAKLLAVQIGAPGVWRERLVQALEQRNQS